MFPSPFGRYCLEEKIAAGGMAEIFKAKLVGVEGFEKTVAIKRILPFWSERPDFIRMLVDEAKVLVHLNHPNIVQVFELGRVGPTYFIAMEYVAGCDLRHLVRYFLEKGLELSPAVLLSVLVKSLRGLHYAHERRLPGRGSLEIVHRDISPQNILLGVEGEVKVSDFGIAKAITQSQETQTGVLKGKYAFMSPEQAMGKALDRRSDLFSMGTVLYELMMGRRLFAASSDLETLERVREAQIPWPREATARLMPGVKAVLAKALARDKPDRFQSAEAFAVALEGCLPGGKAVDPAKVGEAVREAFSEKPISTLPGPTERRTAVAADSVADTVSLVAGPASGSGPRVPFAKPARKYLPYLLAFLWLLAAAGLAWWIVPQFSRESLPPEGHGSLPSHPKTPVEKPPPPVVPGPLKAMGTLVLQVQPDQALIRAKVGDREETGRGRLVMGSLPLGVPIEVKAQLEGYEDFSQKIEIASGEPNVKREVQLKKIIPPWGGLRVNAVPWGRVTVPGILGGQETPVVRGKIQSGSYSVVVANPGMGKTLSTRVNIIPGHTTVCTADFEGNSKIRCR